MLGPSIRTVFTSRWKALMWSAGILMTAYCSIPSAEETGEGGDASARQAEAAYQAFTGKSAPGGDDGAQDNPWAKDRN